MRNEVKKKIAKLHKSKTNPQNQKRNEEKSFKLLKKSLQSCKVAEKITPKPQSCMRKQEKVKREMKKKVAKLHQKSGQKCKVAQE